MSITTPIPRVDAQEKAAGAAAYIADFDYATALTARFYRSDFPRGRITGRYIPELPSGYYWVDHTDVPGKNAVVLIKDDLPAFAEEEIRYRGQIIGILCGPDPLEVDRLLREVAIEYEPIEPAPTLDDGISCKGGAMHGEDNVFARLALDRGDVDTAFAGATKIVEGTYETGFQEQLYMEPQGLVSWFEGGTVVVHGSMQCPYYVKHSVEVVMGDAARTRIKAAVIGGGFGGKEDYPEIMGAPLSVAALKVGRAEPGRPLRMIYDRTEDMAFTSKRHPSRTKIRTAHDEDGTIRGIESEVTLDGGAYETYSLIVLMRAIFHSTGAYHIPNAKIRGRAVATTTVPSGAFRGFGAPQSLFSIEMHMQKCARTFGVEPLAYRRRFFQKKGDRTVTGGLLRDEVILDRLLVRLDEMSGYGEKQKRYAAEAAERRNASVVDAGSGAHRARGQGGALWRGIGISVFNHGAGFTGDGEQRIIKGKAAVHKRADDVVEIRCATTDMGQGPKTTFRKVVGAVLDIVPEEVVFVEPDTDICPDSGPTVASRTMMVVGFLLQEAAKELKATWTPGEEQTVTRAYEMPPGMAWDQNALDGDAYAAFGWGVNACEVEVDPVTYEVRVVHAWGVYDVGKAIDERVVNGQIQGGMSQALGYGAIEKLHVDETGTFLQRTMADYIIPTALDFPRTGADTIDNPYTYGPFGAKGMGEMVHDGGHMAYAAAVEQAIGAACPRIPLVPEVIMEIRNDET